MNSFVYIAHDLTGVEKRGLKRGTSRQEVLAWLHEHGLIPIEVKRASTASKSALRRLNQKAPKPSELASFCWQLETMIEGGVAITESIETVASDIENRSFRGVLLEVSERIKCGESFSDSVAEFPKVFSRLFCAMILAGETSGSLPTILRRLAEYFENRADFRKKVKGALAYPVFVVSFVLIILVIMMTVIIPKFRLIFADMGGDLPPFTQSFLNFYDHMASNIIYILFALVSFVALFSAYIRTPDGQARLCGLALRIPLFGKLTLQAFDATFCKTLSTLLAAGVSIIEAFDILAEMTNNIMIKDAILTSKMRVIEGSNISAGMAESGLFPNMVSRMVEVGEKSGSLPKVLDRSSKYFENKMDATITTLLSLLGPAVIVVVGVIVMVVVIALYLPIFSMSDVAH